MNNKVKTFKSNKLFQVVVRGTLCGSKKVENKISRH